VVVVHVVIGFSVLVLNLAAGAWGAWRWYRVEPSPRFWPLLRAAQVAVLLEALDGGVLLLLGRHVASLHLLYGLLPIPVSFVAEQLRLVSAQSVLNARGYESAQAVGDADAEEQRSVVRSIVCREMGVMAASALVIVGLASRAAFGAGGF
jgi:hypothetical protein